VDIHPQLTQVGQIRSEPGGGNDPVVRTDLPVSGPEHNTVGAAIQFKDPEASHKPDPATLYEPTGIAAKLSTLRQLIVRPTSEDRRGIGTSGHPRDLGVRAGFGQRGEVADGVLGRVTATHDHGPQPLEPVPTGTENVRGGMGDPLPHRRLAERWAAVRPERIRCQPGARGVDDSPCQRTLDPELPLRGDHKGVRGSLPVPVS
jgi:hypothetical protein